MKKKKVIFYIAITLLILLSIPINYFIRHIIRPLIIDYQTIIHEAGTQYSVLGDDYKVDKDAYCNDTISRYNSSDKNKFYNPNKFGYCSAVAYCYKHFKNYEMAISFYKKALKYKPIGWDTYQNSGKAQAYEELGECYFSQNKYDEAISNFKKSVELKGYSDTEITAHYYLGLAYMRTGKKDFALKESQILKESFYSIGKEFSIKLLEEINKSLK